MKMSLKIWVRGNKNFILVFFMYFLLFLFLRVFQFYFQADIYNYQPLHLPQPKESTKENKENTHRFLRLHGVLRRSAVFSFFGFAESFLPRKLPTVKQCSAFQGIFAIIASIKPPSKANTGRTLAIYPRATQY